MAMWFPQSFANRDRKLSPGLNLALLVLVGLSAVGKAQNLETELLQIKPEVLAREAIEKGDAQRGAILFFQAYMSCAKCHSVSDSKADLLGPNLAVKMPDSTDVHLIESMLQPSKVIRKGFESIVIATQDGQVLQGVLVGRTPQSVQLREASKGGEVTTIAVSEIASEKSVATSTMPAGQVNQLASRQQFLDLVRYLQEIRDGGFARAQALQPAPSLIALVIPEYEKKIDHARFIRQWDEKSLKRGAAIYQRVCANCHGTKEQPGSLPNSLRFAEGKFKNGSDPFAIYQTLTHGFGFMVPQSWMVPSQKYDVIHYIREEYVRKNNPSQWIEIDEPYLAKLPRATHWVPSQARSSLGRPWIMVRA